MDPRPEERSVLCLAAGGGQQGPLFASLGLEVTVVDISPAQLETDREVAHRRGLAIETVEADMLDLSQLHGAGFDLVYQPVSALYVPDVPALDREVARTLRPGATITFSIGTLSRCRWRSADPGTVRRIGSCIRRELASQSRGTTAWTKTATLQFRGTGFTRSGP